MASVTRTKTADRDLRGIVRYIARDSLSAAVNWLDEMERLFQMLGAHPQAGERYRSRRHGEIRRHAAGRYVVYYRPRSDGVCVVRVLQGMRDERRIV